MNEVLTWLKKPLYPEEIIIWFKANDIVTERLSLFRDFIDRFFNIVNTTYLGYDISNPIVKPLSMNYEDNVKHFNWCWKKNIELFKKEGLNFSLEGEHKEFLFNIIGKVFYNNGTREDAIKTFLYLCKLFDVEYEFSKSDLDILTEIYKKIEKNFENLYSSP